MAAEIGSLTRMTVHSEQEMQLIIVGKS